MNDEKKHLTQDKILLHFTGSSERKSQQWKKIFILIGFKDNCPINLVLKKKT